MDNLDAALLLLDINKTDLKLALFLSLISRSSEKDKGQVYKIREVSTMTGLPNVAVINSLNNLANKNVIGKLVFEEGLVDRKVATNFDKAFLSTIQNKKKPIKEAVYRVGFYISDDVTFYVFNPIIDTWKYPTWRKLGKALKLLKEKTKNPFINYLVDNKDNGKNIDDGKVNGWSIKETINLYVEKFKKNYNAIYSIDWGRDYTIIKNLLMHLKTNNVPDDRLEDFLDFSFDQAKKVKGRKVIVNIPNLKYYANKFITNVVQEKTAKYERDEQGNLKVK